MGAWKFSLIALLSAVTLAAVACGALVNPNEWWTIGVMSASVALLAFVVLAAIFGGGERRAFWGGAAVIGWGYFGLVAFALGFNLDNYGATPLVTCRLLGMLGESRFDAQQQTLVGQGVNSNAGVANAVFPYPLADVQGGNSTTGSVSFWLLNSIGSGSASAQKLWTCFYSIGHCLWSLFLGMLGGLVAVRLALARERQASQST